MLDEEKLTERLKRREIQAFKQLVAYYSDDLLLFAYALTGNGSLASEIVAQVLLKVFEEAPTTGIPLPLRPYLQEQVRRACDSSLPNKQGK
jgi:DNA-directed RNA polymerase specialized sigma24 family protein